MKHSHNISSFILATEIQNFQTDSSSPSLTVPEKGPKSDKPTAKATLPAKLFRSGMKYAIVSILYQTLDKVIGNSSQQSVEMMFSAAKSSAEIDVLSKVLSVSIVPQPDNASLFSNYPVTMTFRNQVEQVICGSPVPVVLCQ